MFGGFFTFLVLFLLIFSNALTQISTTKRIIGSTTTYAAITTNFQRKTFYADGYHWVFYCNGSHMLYTTSGDGLNWDIPVIINEGISSSGFSVWYRGDVYYVYCSGAPGTPVVYMRGSISNNRIDWEVVLNVVTGLSGYEHYNAYCTIDGEGYPWIAYLQYDGFNYSSWIVKAKDFEGMSWNNPTKISDSIHPLRISLMPLNDGKVYAIYTNSKEVSGRLWNGSFWMIEEIITKILPQQDYGYSAVSHNDTVHLALLESLSNDIFYFNFTYGSGWQGGQIIQESQSSISFPVLSIDETTKSLYVFWIYDDDVNVKIRTEGYWEDLSGSAAPFGKKFNSPKGISCFCKAYNGKIGVVTLEGQKSPFILKYYFFPV